jgi:hypothetical protein
MAKRCGASAGGGVGGHPERVGERPPSGGPAGMRRSGGSRTVAIDREPRAAFPPALQQLSSSPNAPQRRRRLRVGCCRVALGLAGETGPTTSSARRLGGRAAALGAVRLLGTWCSRAESSPHSARKDSRAELAVEGVACLAFRTIASTWSLSQSRRERAAGSAPEIPGMARGDRHGHWSTEVVAGDRPSPGLLAKIKPPAPPRHLAAQGGRLRSGRGQ